MNTKRNFLTFNYSLISSIIILFLFTTIKVNATDYYISATGDDTADGLTTATPWLSIDKVMRFSQAFLPVAIFILIEVILFMVLLSSVNRAQAEALSP